MADEVTPNQNTTPQAQNPQQGFLNQTLGNILQNNNQAQGMVMKAMQISPQQFQQLLTATGNNQMMNTTIGDLFKNGVVHQAVQSTNGAGPIGQLQGGQAVQLSPEQMQQIMNTIQTVQPVQLANEQQVAGPPIVSDQLKEVQNALQEQSTSDLKAPKVAAEPQVIEVKSEVGPDDKVPYNVPQSPKQSLMDKIKTLFK